MEKIIDCAKETGTILEVDGNIGRLDLKDEHIKIVIGKGVKISIDTDAHHSDHFGFMKFGIAQARRGWAEKKDVINTRSLEKMIKLLK